MKNIFTSIIGFAIIQLSFSQWTQQTSGTNQQLWSIDFVDENIGYATCDNGISVKTTNGGTNWNSFPTFTGTFLEFIDLNTAFGFVVDTEMHLQKSTDGGFNWQTKISSPGGFGRFHFPNSSTGYLSGMSSDTDSLLIYKSTDGGENWNYIYGYYMSASYFGSLYFIDSNTGFYSDELGRLFRSNNGGLNWSIVYTTSVGSSINSIDFPTTLIGYAATDVSYLKTIDGGLNWIETNLPFTSSFLDIECTDNNTCYIVGGDGFSTGTLIKTTNGGANWVNTTVPCDLLWDVDFINDSIGFTCGIDGVIMKYELGSTSILETEDILLNIYPNPAYEYIHIQVDEENIFVNYIEVMNISGKLVKSMINTEHKNITMDVKDLTLGIYFLKIITSNGKYFNKKVLIK